MHVNSDEQSITRSLLMIVTMNQAIVKDLIFLFLKEPNMRSLVKDGNRVVIDQSSRVYLS